MNQKNLFDVLKEHKENKDLDVVQERMYKLCTESMLTNFEVAAILFSVFHNILHSDSNKKYLEKIGIDVEKIDVDTVFEVQKILAKEYIREFNKNLEE
ncbi:hypothetical protein MFLO_02498 [Listeria floridensis FSL S10-1187]|uniref:Phage protein n=1 Tax=Listeria floridensis FSL S10-1187 TaxID=1265817 RepID=A0ABP3B0W6_9LIST|nr:hypothetical protein [Listeria floridensis]EUJ33531.1 hypothetical protein MFLO_02498 [Listeria floridensis FSL S10-1187]